MLTWLILEVAVICRHALIAVIRQLEVVAAAIMVLVGIAAMPATRTEAPHGMNAIHSVARMYAIRATRIFRDRPMVVIVKPIPI